MPATYAQYLSERSPKFRNHLKRTERKVGELADVQVVECSKPADVAVAYERLMHIERASWKHAHGTAITTVRETVERSIETVRGRSRCGPSTSAVPDGRRNAVAFNLGYVASDCYSYLKTSYDERYKPLGVATYLRARLVETLIDRGTQALDFPAEPYEWERQWTEKVRWHKVLTIYRHNRRWPRPVARRSSSTSNRGGQSGEPCRPRAIGPGRHQR